MNNIKLNNQQQDPLLSIIGDNKENTSDKASPGSITVITGPMFSGKSGKLIKTLQKYEKKEMKRVKAYKPVNDNRFSDDKIVSRMDHYKYSFPATNLPLELPDDVVDQILLETESYDVIGFDEAQFFKKNIMKLVEELASRGKEVIVAGLNMDYRGKEFGFIGGLMAISDEIIKLFSDCNVCASPKGSHTQRIVNEKPAKNGPIVSIGDTESYQSRCRKCYVPPHKA